MLAASFTLRPQFGAPHTNATRTIVRAAHVRATLNDTCFVYLDTQFGEALLCDAGDLSQHDTWNMSREEAEELATNAIGKTVEVW